MNSSSYDEVNNDEVALDPPTNNLNINYNYDDEKNDYEVTPDIPTNGGNNEILTMIKTETMKKWLRRKNIMKT